MQTHTSSQSQNALFKRIVSIFVATLLLVAAVILTGCSKEKTPDQSDDLTIWIKSDDNRDYIQRVIELYEKDTGNKVEVTLLDNNEFEGKAIDAFKNGKGPDILLHFNNSLIKTIGEDNFLVLNDQAWVDDLMESSHDYSSDSDDNLLGLPFWEASISGCYFNKAILNSFGLRMATTQSEFNTLCATLKNIGYTPLYWGGDCGWFYQFGLDPIFADNPELLDQLNAGEITYADIPQVHDMVQWIYDAYKNGWLYGADEDMGLEEASAPIASGDVVMVNIWDTWFEEDFKAGTYNIGDFAVMPIFMGTSDRGTYEGGNLNMMLVNKNAKHLDEAIGFLEFCADPAVYNEIFAGVPSNKVFKGQDTILTTEMIANADSSIEKLQRASTAEPKILGYTQENVKAAFKALFKGEVDVDGCIALMDQQRLETKRML